MRYIQCCTYLSLSVTHCFFFVSLDLQMRREKNTEIPAENVKERERKHQPEAATRNDAAIRPPPSKSTGFRRCNYFKW